MPEPRPLRALLVEDSETDAELVAHELPRAGFAPTLERVDSAEAMRSALEAHDWDIVFCDYNIPGFSFGEAIEIHAASRSDAPVVILSGTIGEEAVVEALKAGARDCILKSNLGRLGPVIERELGERELRRSRRDAEEELEATAEVLSAIFRSTPVAIVASDPPGRVTMWNPAAERMFGWKAEEVLGRPIPTFLPEEAEATEELRRRALVGESITDVEGRRVRKDGRVVDVSVSLTPLRDARGEVYGVMATLADVSEQVRDSRQLQESFELLQKVDAERRRLLERLVWAQEEERARIASDIHDDSVQVMTALVLRLELLRRRIDDPELLDAVEEVERTARSSITRLRHLIFELRPPALDRDGLAAALRLYLEQTRIDRGIEFSLESGLDSEPGPETRAILYRIAQEALANVAKHARASRVDVALEGMGNGVLVRVRDDGLGFSEKWVESPEPGHLGLLAMRERAEMAGGWWRIESAEGSGTKVEFFVPDQVQVAGEEVT